MFISLNAFSSSHAFEEKFRMTLFDDTQLDNLLVCFREGGPFRLDNLDVEIVGIALQYGQFFYTCAYTVLISA
jgi:hypothetical protein